MSNNIESVVGKTITAARYIDTLADPYVIFSFTDGSEFVVTETQQSGAIAYGDNREVKYD